MSKEGLSRRSFLRSTAVGSTGAALDATEPEPLAADHPLVDGGQHRPALLVAP